MLVETLNLIDGTWHTVKSSGAENFNPDIVFLFGDTDVIKVADYYQSIRQIYPEAIIVGCSSSGNILGVEITNSPLIATAVQFKSARVKLGILDFSELDSTEEVENQVANIVSELEEADLKHLFVLSDGLNMNGSRLVSGLNQVAQVSVTGGMAGDGARFQETWVVANDEAKQSRIAVVAFYGESITISHGCYGGWSEFGTERIITRSDGNVLYEVDHQPALDLYKEYLGEYASDLPNSGLRFPLSIKQNDEDPEVIRTLLGIDETTKSITFAGDVPEGFRARLMKPDIDVLIDGAGLAAKDVNQANTKQALGLVVSCVGRKIVMGQMVEEELDAVEEILGDNVQLTGFYSYGEISPVLKGDVVCSLHNQTMTLTTIYED